MEKNLTSFEAYLIRDEKREATVRKYVRDVKAFLGWLGDDKLCKEKVIAYKEELRRRYQPAGVNGRLVAVNRYLGYLGKGNCRVRLLKIQQRLFAEEDRELTLAEYRRLIRCAGKKRIYYVMQTICGTGIRVSELQFVTVEAVRTGRAEIDNKGKSRVVLIPESVREMLREYCRRSGRESGSVFVTRCGNPLDRSNVWQEMKALCEAADVSPKKVFPHNLRHLFARTYYQIKKDIVRLADILGHSSVNTTRIYTAESGEAHFQGVNAVGRMLFTT